MEQRPLRLGDIVDDYCPRERRITNHAIVALVGEAIRQTRCTTCDAEHIYKEAKVPRRKKPDAPVALTKPQSASPLPVPLAAADDGPDDPVVSDESRDGQPGQDDVTEAVAVDGQENRPDEVWSAHRPLIRATLPRTEGEPPTPRPIPEFTMHQRRTRGGHGFRQGWQGNSGNGFSRNGFRPGGGRSAHGQGQGQGHGNGPGHGRHESSGRAGRRHGSKNKRSR
jgi:hypothetical protein